MKGTGHRDGFHSYNILVFMEHVHVHTIYFLQHCEAGISVLRN